MSVNNSIIDLLTRYKVVPIIKNQTELLRVARIPQSRALFLSHGNLFDFLHWLCDKPQREPAVYIDIDHMNGIHADTAALRYLAEQIHVAGIVSTNPKILGTAKALGLETILHLFAADSTGLESMLDVIDPSTIDLFSISPGLVIPYISPPIARLLPHKFIGSGLISTEQHIQAIVNAGAIGVAVNQSDLWSW